MAPPVHASTSKSPSKSQLSSIEIIKRQRSCRRLLFGVPDRQELDEWFKKTAEKREEEARIKWNFDFAHGVPLNSTEQSSSTYEFEKMDEKEVPKFYRSTTAKRKLIPFAHSRLHLNGTSTEHHKELKRSESTPLIGNKTPIKSPKKAISQTNNDHHPKQKAKHPIKSPKKKVPKNVDKSKPSSSSKNFEHTSFPPTRVF